MIRYSTEHPKANRILDLTSLTVAEFETLVPAFEAGFVQHMADWTLEGTPRMKRRYSQYAACPLPTPEDRLLFLLMYLKQAPTQVAHGAAFGMGQPKANQWLHILLVALRNALHTLGDVPSRGLTDLQHRVTDTAGDPAVAPFYTMAPSVPFRAPKTQMNKPVVIAARKSGTR
jgi:hypothetical protein